MREAAKFRQGASAAKGARGFAAIFLLSYGLAVLETKDPAVR